MKDLKNNTTTISKVAIQGFEGSFHHIAAENFFGDNIELVCEPTFHKLINETKNNGSIDVAVMAVENSIAGSILPNYQLLQKSGLHITGEVYLQIRHNLLGVPGTAIEKLQEVHSHPMAILQCEEFFLSHPHIKLVETDDTALSAKRIKENADTTKGAIASHKAMEIYNLEILEESIETVKNNFTRFLILEKEPNPDDYGNKATIQFQVENNPGALLKGLKCIAENGVNISKIQSIPEIDREWRYYFHLDLEYDTNDVLIETLRELGSVTKELQLLGTYKRGKQYV